MANLRTNNLCGDGGTNAIKGSVYFGGVDEYLDISSSAIAAAIPGGDEPYTIEMWAYFGRSGSNVDSGGSDSLIAYGSNSTRSYNGIDWTGSAIRNVWYGDDLSYTVDLTDGLWHHIAATYDQTTRRLFVDGNLGASDTPSDHSVGTTNNGKIGASTGGVVNRDFRGYISNLRITKRAIYTAAFTPPAQELTAVDDTMLLCCQDSDNALQEATGKTITGVGRYADSSVELVPNGGPTTDVTGWTAYNSSVAYDTGQIKVTRSGGTGFSAYATLTNLVIGQRYKVSAQIRSANSRCDLYVTTAVASGTLLSLTGPTGATADVSGEFTATSGTSYVFTAIDGDGHVGYYNRVSVKAADYGDAPKFIPPYGVDAGNTFNGAISMNTPSYMYFPTGRTEGERGRGRAVLFQGLSDSSGGYTNNIDFIEIQTLGNSMRFGDLGNFVGLGAGISNSTRGIFAGGSRPTQSPFSGGNQNFLEFVTIATTGNGQDFGGVSTLFRYGAGISNSTRGLICGAYQGGGASGTLNNIQYLTIATLGDTLDFGDMTNASGAGVQGMGATSSPTRGITFGGGTPSTINEINSITIGTLGNSVDFGDLSSARYLCQGVSNGTRGVVAGGDNSGAINIIEFITIASTGDAQDFGDLSSISEFAGGTGGSNKIRGVFVGRGDWTATDNAISYITIATAANAQDFGDIRTPLQNYGSNAMADSHGGL